MAKKPKAPKEVSIGPPKSDRFLPPPPPPISLHALHGQDRATRILQDALRSDRIHHAWIFHGPQGVGKCTAAISFASLLLDPTTQATFSGDFESDPDSPTQQLLKAGTHPDLKLIVKELAKYSEDPSIRKLKLTSIPVDVLREFMIEPGQRSRSSSTSARASRVFIVDEAELMRGPSQNAILKMLEEPSPGVVIILITSAEDILLPTIRSRSQRIYFSALNQPAMHQWLTKQTFDPPISQEEERFLLEFADGSPGAFLAAHKGGIYAWWQRIGSLLVGAEKGQYSLDLGNAMTELVNEYSQRIVDENDQASKEAANKEAASWMFKLIGSYIRRRLRDASRATNASRAVAPYLTMLDKLREAEDEMDANVQAQFVMEKLSAELTTM